MTDTSKFFAALIASLIVVSSLGGVAIAPAEAQTGTDGMLALGDAQVSEDVPADADLPIRASDLEGAVYASDHADTLEVVLTTPERAEEYMGENASVLADDEIAIVLRDDEISEGRDVAIDLEVLETGVGFVPEVAYGTHEDGEQWRSAIEREGTVGRFHVPHFSENAVTFTGGVEISATPATDGSQFSYELSDLDSASNVTVNLTGVDNTEWNNHSTTRSGDGDTISLTIAGNAEPLGPSANGEPTLTLSGVKGLKIAYKDTNGNLEYTDSEGTTTDTGIDPNVAGGIGDIDGDGDIDVLYTDSSNLKYVDPAGNTADTGADVNAADSIYDVDDFDGDGNLETAYKSSGGGYLKYVDGAGNIVNTSVSVQSVGGIGDVDGDGDMDIVYDDSGIKFRDSNGNVGTTGVSAAELGGTGDIDGDGDQDIAYIDGSGNLKYTDANGNTGSTGVTAQVPSGVEDLDSDGTVEIAFKDSNNNIKLTDSSGSVTDTGNDGYSIGSLGRIGGSGTTDPQVDIDGDGTNEVSYSGTLSGSKTYEIASLGTADDSWDVTLSGGQVDVSASIEERTQTEDPAVELNSESVSHDGTLSDGEKRSFSIPSSALREGTNRVNVSVGDGSLSSDAPPAAVGLELSHEATDEQSVDYGAETWSERYNVSRTYGDATEDPTLTIPFEGEVVDINSVDVRRNGGSWGPPKEWVLDNTTLTVAFDPIDAGDTLEVRATGRKVVTKNGDIQVLEPTVEGDDLNSKIEITDRSEGFAIDVSGSDRIHHTAEESWSGSSYVVVESGGDQELRLPEASVGSQTRVRTAPINVVPESGASEVVIEDAEEPRFQIREGNTTGAATVEVTYYDTLSGERYVLWSESQEREIDADRAESPVSFVTDGDSDTYTIRQIAAEGSTGGVPPPETRDVGAPLVLVVPAVGVSVTGLFWAGRRFGGARGIRGNALLLVGSTVVAIAAVELVAPGTLSSIFSTLIFALGDSVAGGIGAAVAAVAVFVGLWQLQQRTRADIPWWVIGPAMGIAAIAALEAIRPGSVLGALEVVLSEYGGLVVLGGLAIVGYVIYQRRKTQQAEASTPDTQVEFDLGEQD